MKKKYEIKFRSGNSVTATEETVKAMRDWILKGAKQWQCNEISENGETRYFLINLLEVDYIATIEDIS